MGPTRPGAQSPYHDGMRLRLLTTALLAFGVAAQAETFEAALLAGSVVEYEIRDGISVIVGTAPVAWLELRFDDDDVRGASLLVRVDAARFDSGNPLRDSNARRTVFDTDEFPTISFELLGVDAEPVDLPEGATRILTVRGRLTLHGVEREVEVPLEVTRAAGRLSVVGGFELLLSEYAMTRPRVLFLLVDDRVVVRVRIDAELTPAP